MITTLWLKFCIFCVCIFYLIILLCRLEFFFFLVFHPPENLNHSNWSRVIKINLYLFFLYFGDHLGRLIYSYSEIKYNLMVLLLENFNVGGRQSFKRWLGWNSWNLTEFWIFFCSSLIFSKFCTSPPPWPSRSLMRDLFRNLNLITIYQNFHWTVKQLLPKPN